MALKSVKQLGSSLVEFMIAALLGGIALTIVGSVFLSNQKSAAVHSQQILLQQQISGVLHQIKKDIQRAGYNGVTSESLQLSATDEVVYSQPTKIGYVYRLSPNSVSNTLYRLDNGRLQYCQQEKPSPLTVVELIDKPCFDLFDSKQVKIEKFDIELSKLVGNNTQSAFIKLTISAHLVGNKEISHQQTISILQRNWQ
ncbi:pilus assembly protein PilW [Vibrio navarrensis]|uniref:pilus assembly protein PilW n=1 Tax=Vibrio navarrensis TaxID=29495 RepID=UPI00186A85DA|nr:pilus assembly protein PilW [Vibrio navarrensis]EJK2115513.1 pilus assembly protein PilW [Vibrio navarrensis]MBE4576806.1 pilus assembly protein PilW [Vibrio navarrensis]MBE4580259.1 pilus assembly protein PilW [Vibrio navarrensis]MBE4594998.1 pilus assembly protein PilW [Vibrio navarrensis]